MIPATVSPFDTTASITPKSGTPEAKLKVPSTGSIVKASSASPSPSSSASFSEHASSPTITASGKRSLSLAVMYRSAFTSASVTRSAADVFCLISPASSLRNRGMISSRAASASKSASQSICPSSKRMIALSCIVQRQSCEIEQLAIQQMAWTNIRHGADHRVLAARHALLDVGQHGFHRIALQPFLAAAQVARNDRELHRGREFLQIVLRRIGQRTEHHQVALVIDEFRRHCGKAPAMEQVHEESFENIFPVVAQHHRRAALLTRDPIRSEER